MAGGIVETIAVAGGPAIGGGIGLWGAFRFARWAIEFYFKRRDLREERLDLREKALEKRYDDRLRHLESELGRTRQAMMLLINDTAANNPMNPVLMKVAELLAYDDPNVTGPFSRKPPTEPLDGASDLLDQLRDQPGTRRRHS